jgi:selenocysteine lyase/cysteine desulfurase
MPASSPGTPSHGAPLPCQRALFDIPRDVAYLNCAYMSPLLHSVREAGQRAVARKAHPWTITPGDFFTDVAEARELFAGLIGARADDIAVVPSVSYGMAVACANLPVTAGQRVLMLDEEFPSVILSWRERARAAGAEVVLIPRPADDDWTSAVLAAIDERTAHAALPVCHWTDGGLLDLERIAARLREVGATLSVDATQSLGAVPFDAERVAPDMLVAAAYKWLLGPYTLGFLYVAPRWQEGRPLEHNWIARAGSEDFGGLVRYQDAFQPGARRFDMGELSNFALIPMAIAALRQIHAWGVPGIATTLGVLTGEIAGKADRLGLHAVSAGLRAPHYLGLRFPGGLPQGLGTQLADHGVYVSVRGTALRVTPHLYNDAEDIARFFTALGAALDTPQSRT